MTKLFKIVAIFFLAQLIGSYRPVSETHSMTDFVAAKSRTLIITLLSGFIVASLFSGGIILTLIALALWMGTPTVTTLWLLYVGVGLVSGSGLIMLFAFSKKRFEQLAHGDTRPSRSINTLAHGVPQLLEEIFSTLIKDLIREKPTTTAASTPIQPHPA